mgnify:CR=1 FL=1
MNHSTGTLISIWDQNVHYYDYVIVKAKSTEKKLYFNSHAPWKIENMSIFIMLIIENPF